MSYKVTIMIPTYNQANYIAEAIQSALNQDYENLEIIISDDCSSDGTAEIITPFLKDERIKYFRNSSNIGRVKNYKKSLYERATGDWVVNLDGDDYFTDKQFISKALISIKQGLNLGSHIVGYLANHSNIKKVDKNLITHVLDENSIIIDGKQYFLNYTKIGAFSHMACIYNRSKAMELDFYNENFLAIDFLSFMKLALQGDLVLSNYKIGVWRKHDENASQNNLLEKYQENNIVIGKLAHFSSNLFDSKVTQHWLNNARVVTRDGHVFDMVINAKRFNKFKTLLFNFRFKYKYFMLLFNLIRNFNFEISTRKESC